MKKARLAVGYGSICGGCDVAFTDVGTKLAELAEAADIIYWPAVVDGKIEQLREISGIDIGIYFGAVRTEHHEMILHLLEEKSEILVAFGTCPCYGGIPALGNVETSDALLQIAYSAAPNTTNKGIPVVDKLEYDGMEIPKLEAYTAAPADLVDFDVFVPGCPPPVKSVSKLIDIVKSYAAGETIPEKHFIAEEKSVCDLCPREKPEIISIEKIKRIHETEWNENECFLSQGILCLGPVTRAGCGEEPRCIQKNMPCRGCFGPLPKVRDQGTKFLSSIASSVLLGKEKGMTDEDLQHLVKEQFLDPVGQFYRFALAVAAFNRRYTGD
ncbi:hypothetical protein EU545_02130 [Candidatus Thorarchaeota archaeon]|nr:MAG: hypothetical protein EU545_02130 [Candidatus Thorarchaeota archaeon]